MSRLLDDFMSKECIMKMDDRHKNDWKWFADIIRKEIRRRGYSEIDSLYFT